MTAPREMNRRQLFIAAGLVSAVVIPAGMYGIPRLFGDGRDGQLAGEAKPLDDAEVALVSAMAEGIIPATDTPGALEAGVGAFIAMMFSDWMTDDEQTAFRAGLKAFEADAHSRFGSTFAACSPAEQVQLLTAWDADVTARRNKGAKELPPFAKFKSMTVIGYYTSEIGQEKELKAEMDGGQDDPNGPLMMPLPFNV